MPQDPEEKRDRRRKHVTGSVRAMERKVGEAEAKASRVPGTEEILAMEAKRARARAKKEIKSGRMLSMPPAPGAGALSRDELYEEARRRNIKGRSSMTKAQLEHALRR
ncbi:plasmid stabilization protein [Catellatospora methionotrophica]|uniref:plasmid stabilization protein n=1 Tax=Catellatospora methionotrophica TaxID=121620 RepID=UPI003405ED53